MIVAYRTCTTATPPAVVLIFASPASMAVTTPVSESTITMLGLRLNHPLVFLVV